MSVGLNSRVMEREEGSLSCSGLIMHPLKHPQAAEVRSLLIGENCQIIAVVAYEWEVLLLLFCGFFR